MNHIVDNEELFDREAVIEKMCSNKLKYSTRKSAKAAISYRNRLRKKNGEPLLIPYKCPYCGHYHITTIRRKSDAEA